MCLIEQKNDRSRSGNIITSPAQKTSYTMIILYVNSSYLPYSKPFLRQKSLTLQGVYYLILIRTKTHYFAERKNSGNVLVKRVVTV